jgi:photosystem II stability/assembly factor-like uncharacterized protein
VRAAFPAFLLIMTALNAAPAAAAPLWQTLPNAPSSIRIDGLHFIDARTGWVATGSGEIWRTNDGGDTWANQFTDEALYFRCIAFADAQHGFAGTLSSSHTLYKTSNGGATWSLVTNVPTPRPNALCGIWAPSPSVIYGVGSYAGPARLIKSVDGGATWTSKDLAPQATTMIDAYFTSETEGFIVGGLGTFSSATKAVVLHTSDGGATWQQRWLGPRTGEWCWKISFPSPDTGYVSLERNNPPMHFLRTVDGGATWTEMVFPDYNEQGIGFATPKVGWMGGADNPTFGTTDGGVTWTPTPWGEYIDRFQFLVPTLGYASGVTVYRYSEQTVGVPPGGPPPAKPTIATLPNPFVAHTTIRYTLPESRDVVLFIADPAGRVVRRLEDGDVLRTAGPHQVEWDGKDDAGRDVPAGVYLYVLHAGDQHEMGKLVRVR